MKKIYRISAIMLICSCLFGFHSCKKFLDEKPRKTLAVPTTIEDYQAIMDLSSVINVSSPAGGEVSSDDYYLTDEKWAALAEEGQRRMYTWEKDDLYSNSPYNDWNGIYRAIYSCNTVITGLSNFPATTDNTTELNNVRGQAFFCRGNNFLDAAIVFCLAYDENTASTDLGLPLKLNTDFNESYTRASVRQTYDQIIKDLKASVPLLPVVPLAMPRPSKVAAYGLLSRTYMAMRKYDQAGLYADSCLALKNTILDYNTLIFTGNYPFTLANNTENIYLRFYFMSIISSKTPIAPSGLLSSYVDGDLRKQAYFKLNTDGSDTYWFRGGYAGNQGPFSGIATDEMYLNKAECLARQNKFTESMEVLNTLLIKRWDKDKSYPVLTAVDGADALRIVLRERRKEMVMRTTRWMDIKRLNKEGANISLTRTLNGKTYTLPANDLRFALPIPDDIIAFSGVPQNPRQ